MSAIQRTKTLDSKADGDVGGEFSDDFQKLDVDEQVRNTVNPKSGVISEWKLAQTAT